MSELQPKTSLLSLENGRSGRIASIEGDTRLIRRMLSLGLRVGSVVNISEVVGDVGREYRGHLRFGGGGFNSGSTQSFGCLAGGCWCRPLIACQSVTHPCGLYVSFPEQRN